MLATENLYRCLVRSSALRTVAKYPVWVFKLHSNATKPLNRIWLYNEHTTARIAVNIAVRWLDRPQRGEFPDEFNNAARVLTL